MAIKAMRKVIRRKKTVKYGPLSKADNKSLSETFHPPLDCMNCFKNWAKWRAVLMRGLLLLVIGLKYPVARGYFFKEFKNTTDKTMTERVYKACVRMVQRFSVASAYKVLRSEIDCIKGPALAHGMLTYMRRLSIVKPTRRSDGIKLGAGRQLFRIAPYTAAVRLGIQRFIKMNNVLNELPTPWGLQAYNVNKDIVLQKMTKFKVCQMTSDVGKQYNRLWTFRQYQLAECRFNRVQRLAYTESDTVRMLPGPDCTGARKRLGFDRPVSDLYKTQGVTRSPEYICMSACLTSGRFKQKRVSVRERKKRQEISGRCARCMASNRTHEYCRVKQCHTARAPVDQRQSREVSGRFKHKQVSARELKKRREISGRCAQCMASNRTHEYCRVEQCHTARAPVDQRRR